MAEPDLKSAKYIPAVELARGTLGLLSAGRGPGRLVLLRRIDDKPPWDPAALDRVAESAHKARGIHHPRVLAVIDAVRSPQGLMIVTEYVEGVTLRTLMIRSRKHKLRVPIRAAVRIATELARALGAAEEAFAKRGDRRLAVGLHPETVLISSGDDALIGDLGLTLLAKAPEHPDLIAYRAPELESSEPDSGQLAGVYTVGILLWELLTGREVFGQSSSGANAAGVRKLARQGRVPRLDKVAKDIPSLLAEIVMQAVRSDPTQRFPTLAILAESLTATGQTAGPGELVRYVHKMGADLIARQKSALILRDVAVSSWRPTVHTIETEPTEIPRSSPVPAIQGALATPIITLDGKNALAKLGLIPESEADAAHETVKVDMPAPAAMAPDQPRGSLPLLLVNKPTPTPLPAPANRASATAANLSFDPDELPSFRPRRFPLLLLLLIIGGAIALLVIALKNNWIGGSDDLAVVPPANSAKPALAVSETARPVPPPAPANASANPRERDSAPTPTSRGPVRERPRRESEPKKASPAAGDLKSDNPYVDKPESPKPAPAAS